MYITLKQFSEKHDWPTLPALRALFFRATKDKNKFLSAFRKVGRRVLVSPEKFFKLVEEFNKV